MKVLILILLEDAHWETIHALLKANYEPVLILILLEDAHWVFALIL